MRNDTQVFLNFVDSIFEICLHLINSNCTSCFLASSMLSSGAGTSKKIPLHESGISLPATLITVSFSFFEFSYSIGKFIQYRLLKSICHPTLQSIRRILMCSFLEQISNEPSLQRHNSPNILNSTKVSHTHTARISSVFSIASTEPQILTIHDDSNEPTMPYAFGRQLPIVPPSLNDMNLLPNPINILATMVVVSHTEDGNDNNYSPQSPEPSEPSTITTPPMNVSTFDSWETSYTTRDDNTFYSDGETWRIYFLPSTPTPPPMPRKLKRKMSLGMSFSKGGGVLEHICEANGQIIPSAKYIPGASTKN